MEKKVFASFLTSLGLNWISSSDPGTSVIRSETFVYINAMPASEIVILLPAEKVLRRDLPEGVKARVILSIIKLSSWRVAQVDEHAEMALCFMVQGNAFSQVDVADTLSSSRLHGKPHLPRKFPPSP